MSVPNPLTQTGTPKQEALEDKQTQQPKNGHTRKPTETKLVAASMAPKGRSRHRYSPGLARRSFCYVGGKTARLRKCFASAGFPNPPREESHAWRERGPLVCKKSTKCSSTWWEVATATATVGREAARSCSPQNFSCKFAVSSKTWRRQTAMVTTGRKPTKD